MKKIGLSVCLLAVLVSHAQVGIGTTTPDNSAVLHLNSTSKGILIPKMTSGQRTGIVSPATGLMVYDTDVNQFYFYNGTAWVQAIGPAGTNGNNGKTILNGTTNPSAGTGTNGDFYLNTTTSTLFGPKAAGSWPVGVALIGADGADGTDGTNGTNGTDGKTILNGTTAPSAGIGTNGDFYLRTTTNTLYGPKAGGAWPAGVSLVGPAGADGADGTNGTNGTNGKTILNGTTNPGVGVGTAGDFYLNTATSTLFGPKTTVWPAGVSLIGPQGDTGPSGIASNTSILYANASGLFVLKGTWVMFPAATMAIGSGGALVNMAVSLKTNAVVTNVGCNICYGASPTVGPWIPISTAGNSDIITTELSNTVYRTVTLTGKIMPPVGTWYIGPCFKSSDDLLLYGVMGYVLLPN